jgi:hypothetical protein
MFYKAEERPTVSTKAMDRGKSFYNFKFLVRILDLPNLYSNLATFFTAYLL